MESKLVITKLADEQVEAIADEVRRMAFPTSHEDLQARIITLAEAYKQLSGHVAELLAVIELAQMDRFNMIHTLLEKALLVEDFQERLRGIVPDKPDAHPVEWR